MKFKEVNYFTIQDQIREEEFRYWDAGRNGCCEFVLIQIADNIAQLKLQAEHIAKEERKARMLNKAM